MWKFYGWIVENMVVEKVKVLPCIPMSLKQSLLINNFGNDVEEWEESEKQDNKYWKINEKELEHICSMKLNCNSSTVHSIRVQDAQNTTLAFRKFKYNYNTDKLFS